MSGTRAASALRGVIPGLIVLAVGVLFLLHNLDIVRLGEVRIYWPLLLVAAGVNWALNPKLRTLGIAAVLVGVSLQASNLGYVNIGDLFRFWPLILVTLGIHLLLAERARKQGEWMTGALLLTLGIIFQLQELNVYGASIWRLWPVLVIIAGFAMLQRGLRSRRA